MRQLYIKASACQVVVGIILGMSSISSCQKDYVDIGLDFRPDLSLTIPLLNEDVKLDQFGLDTIAYDAIQAISIPLYPPNGINIPLNIFNRLIPNSVHFTTKSLNNVVGSIEKKNVVFTDSLLTNIQNASLALAFNLAVAAGSTPPAISQDFYKVGQISIGNVGDSYASNIPLSVEINLTNFQNATLECRIKLRSISDSTLTSLMTIPPGGSQTIIASLPKDGQLPIDLSLVSFVYTPSGNLTALSPLFDVNFKVRQEFSQFDALLDTIIWNSSSVSMIYLDSLSLFAPRSQLQLKANTNFLFNMTSNLGNTIRRKIANDGNTLADIIAIPGVSTQYPVGNKTIFGDRDTFEFQSVYYSLNSAIPSALNSRFINTTDVHTFSPKSSSVEFGFNLPIKARGISLSSLAIPFLDSAEFFDPIVSVNVESDSPYGLGFQFEGENFPRGPFGSDSLMSQLAPSGGSFKTVFTFDSSNSQLSTLVSIPLDSLVLKPKVKLIKNGIIHSVSDSSSLKLRPELILPIQGRIRGFTFTDTINLEIDTTLIHYALVDTLLLDFATSNPATLRLRLRIQLLDSNGATLNDQSIFLAEPAPYDIPLSNGLTYSIARSKFYILKAHLKKSKKLVYIIEVGGDDDGRIRLPQQGSIRLEANLVLP